VCGWTIWSLLWDSGSGQLFCSGLLLSSGSLNDRDVAVLLQSAHRSNKLLIVILELRTDGSPVYCWDCYWRFFIVIFFPVWWAYWGMESCFLCEAILRFGRLEIILKPPVLICRLLLGLLKPKDSNWASQMTSSCFWKAHRFIRGGPPTHRDPSFATYAFFVDACLFISLTLVLNCHLYMQMFHIFCLLSEVQFKKL